MNWTAILCSFSVFLSAASHAGQVAVKQMSAATAGQQIEFQVSVEQSSPPANPFDPSESSVQVEFKVPSGKLFTVPAFWFQPFEHDFKNKGGKTAAWIYAAGAPGWRVRFTPQEGGTHQAFATHFTALGETKSAPISFECRAGQTKGFVRVSKEDPRYFEFSDGSTFFPIGQNLAFIGESQYLDLRRATNVFRKMKDNGANFARIWTCAEDWALAIEARKSAFGRSWNWNAPVATLPGRDGYQSDEKCLVIGEGKTLVLAPAESIALRADTSYRLSGRIMKERDGSCRVQLGKNTLSESVPGKKGDWSKFQLEFQTGAGEWWLGDLSFEAKGAGRIWVRDLSLTESGGGPELLWQADVNRSARGWYNPTDCALLDLVLKAAEENQIWLQLCLLTRDHYRSDLADPGSRAYASAIRDAERFLRYAVARWGASPNVFGWEYFNEMDPNAPTQRFHQELGHYLEKIDPYHHLRTTSGWGPAPSQWKHPELDVADLHWYLRPNSKPDWRDEISGVADRAGLVRSSAGNKPALLGEFGLADDKWGRSPHMDEDKQDIHFHNALWASALSGLAGTASFWWWEVLDAHESYAQYKPLSLFLRDIPFASGLIPTGLVEMKNGSRIIGLQDKNQVYAWISGADAPWSKTVLEKQEPAEVKDAEWAAQAMEPGSYQIEWWDPWTGKITRSETISKENDSGLKLSAPPFRRDIAVKVRRSR